MADYKDYSQYHERNCTTCGLKWVSWSFDHDCKEQRIIRLEKQIKELQKLVNAKTN